MQNPPIPIVSISCLTYNHAPYIRQCLDGFMMQKTNFLIEILIHDDVSTDGTTDIIREYEQKYPDIIKPIYQTENQHSKGIRITQTYNLPRARGKYIAICEGDDYWIDPLKLQKQVDFLEAHPDYGLVYTKAKYYNQRQNKFAGYIGSYYGTFENLLLRNVVPTLTVVVRKNLYIKYFHEIKPHKQKWLLGDTPAWLWFARNSKMRYENYVTSVYRELPESVSHSADPEKTVLFERSSISVVEYFIERYGGGGNNTLQDGFLLKTWMLFKFACLSRNRKHLFDKIQMNIDKIPASPLSLRLLYMKLVLYCRPMRHLLVSYIKIQRIVRY